MTGFSNWLYHLSDIKLFIILGVFSILMSIFAISMIKGFMPLGMRYKDNPVIGNTSSLISVIYGVLAGLMALYLINNITYTNDAVQHEANAVANIYRNSKWLDDPVRRDIRADIITYLNQAINVEWPQMRRGDIVTSDGDVIIDKMSQELKRYTLSSTMTTMIVSELLTTIQNLYDARHQRINMSYSVLNPEIWAVILLGTILTLFINYIFGMNFYLHIVTVSAAAIMTSSMIFLLVTLDRPFQGEFTIQSEPLYSVLEYVQLDPNAR